LISVRLKSIETGQRQAEKRRVLTSSGIKPPTTSITLKVLCLLMRDENLQVIKITLTVITPGTSKDFLDVWMTTLLLSHLF
jgi:hypothetical protein